MALYGTGTAVDPWRITTRNELSSVLRDPAGGGYYRLVADISSSNIGLAPIFAGPASTYIAKRIDLNGYTVRFSGTFTADSLEQVVISRVQLCNGIIWMTYTPNATGILTLFYRCALEDCVIKLSIYSASSTAKLAVLRAESAGFPEPALLRRVVFMSQATALAGVDYNYTPVMVTSALAVSDCYVRSTNTAWSNAGITRLTDVSLGQLDAASSGAFTAAGWFDNQGLPEPYQVESVSLLLLTRSAGVAVSRRVFAEHSGQLQFCGETDSEGGGSFVLRVRRNAGFTVFAAEDLVAQVLHDHREVRLGEVCLPPSENGYVYLAQAAGSVGVLSGVVFAGVPITINGIDFDVRLQYPAVTSSRRSVARYGALQALELDTSSGGGGPVVEGDPAYLDGIVEELHPMLGTARPLANSEVAVFERRGSTYVAMGRALSNAVGEFRVETEVYGGGDVFAFAVDFPGVTWQPSSVLSIGDRIRPTVNNGYVYEVISAGTSGAIEPAWWADQGDGTEGLIGTARAKARPYYQPVGDGPRKMTLL